MLFIIFVRVEYSFGPYDTKWVFKRALLGKLWTLNYFSPEITVVKIIFGQK